MTNARLINFIRWSIFFFRDMSPGKRQGWNYRNSIEQKDGCCHFTFFSLYSTPHTYISNKKHQHHCYCYCLAFVFRQPFFTKCLFLIIAWEGLTSSQSLHPKSQLSLSLSHTHLEDHKHKHLKLGFVYHLDHKRNLYIVCLYLSAFSETIVVLLQCFSIYPYLV